MNSQQMNPFRMGRVLQLCVAVWAGIVFIACECDVHEAEPEAVVSSIEPSDTDPLLGAPFKVYPVKGKYSATLVQYPFDTSRTYKGIALYVHGYNDYFFNKELAVKSDSAGYAFFAIDLHNYGRSLRKDEKAFRVRELSEYFPELDSAIEMAQRLTIPLKDSAQNNLPNFLIGHSTGGLIIPLYAEERYNGKNFRGIALTSPFLAMNVNAFVRHILVPVVSAIGSLAPDFPINDLPNPNYSYSLLKGEHGEWDFDMHLKTQISPTKDLGWIRAIHHGHVHVQEGLDLETPILLLHGDCSIRNSTWVDEYSHCDGVLNVDDMKQYGPQLGSQVTLEQIDGGLHDLYLSSKDARDKAYRETFAFFDKQLLN
ncbi:MAG: alpha/beta hydrolase [Fibrobacter sp.]|nr:alpha/beta hydrolase [Fibrobacter sp.]